MNILDMFYKDILVEASNGKIQSFFNYNIMFSTKILEDEVEYQCSVENEDVMIPTLVIKNKEKFNSLLLEYVQEALKFYDDSNFCEEVVSGDYEKDGYCKEKTIIAMLFSNATPVDF